MKLEFNEIAGKPAGALETILERCGPAIRRCFPFLPRDSFQSGIAAVFSITCEGALAGFFWDQKPFGRFRLYGDRETCLVVFPGLRGKGIGGATLDFLNRQSEQRFFVVNQKNQPCLRLLGSRAAVIANEPSYAVFKTCGDRKGITHPVAAIPG